MKTQIAFLLFVAIALAGCASGENDGASGADSSVASSAAAELPDALILETVLMDVLTFDGPRAPRDTRVGKNEKDRILFAPAAATYPRKVEQVLPRDRKTMSALSTAQSVAASQAAADMISRVERKDQLTQFQPADTRIEIQATPPTTQAGLRMNRPIQAWPPGYSEGGNFAVVNLSIPWSIHHADGIYLLEKRAGKWEIVLRDFIYYF